jgi:hypothetical protein
LSAPSVSASSRLAILLPTTPLGVVHGERLLCLADDDNLRISLADRRLRFSYGGLLEALEWQDQHVAACAILTARHRDARREGYLRRRGWEVVRVTQEYVLGSQGVVLKANADFDLAFTAGLLVERVRPDCLLLCGGDGDLNVAIARGVRRLDRSVPVHCLAVPWSASRRFLEPRLFASRILIGEDLVIHRQPQEAHPRTHEASASR